MKEIVGDVRGHGRDAVLGVPDPFGKSRDGEDAIPTVFKLAVAQL
jgi:hypothetical protein